MQKNLVQILMIAFLILGCSAQPTPLPVASPTQPAPTQTPIPPSATATVPPPTLTPLPTDTARPAAATATLESSLQTQGPYFAYFQTSNSGLYLVFVDADGQGRKVIELPKIVREALATEDLAEPNIRLLSPDGKWLAFYTGALKNADLTLNLFNLQTGETQVVTPLLSKDYPNNFTQAAAKLNNPDITADSLHDAFIAGITQAIAWSPDGRYLAFAGQMDGLSSDLYLYDALPKTIHRVSSGDQELQWISWSPDGKWILHSSVYSRGLGMTFDIYAAAVDGSVVKQVSSNTVLFNGIEDWVSPHQYLEYDGENGPGEYGLRMVDVDTGEITKIWDGAFLSYAVSHKWVAMVVSSPDQSPYDKDHNLVMDFNYVPALYLISLKSQAKFKVKYPESSMPSYIYSFGVGEQAFVMQGQDSLMFLSADSQWTKTDLENDYISVAPNFKYWLAIGQQIKLFAADNTLLKANNVSAGSIAVSWRPDSSSAFLLADSRIFSLSIPDGNLNLVDRNLLVNPDRTLTYGWINGQ